MKVFSLIITFMAAAVIILTTGISWAEDGVGGTIDFNADQHSRIANIEQAVETNQGNISENASDIATLMSSGSGVALGIANALFQEDVSVSLPIDTTTVIVSSTINAPVDGFVLAIASLQCRTEGSCDIGVSTSDTLPPYQDIRVSGGPSPTTVHGIFSVPAGDNLVNLLGRSNNGGICWYKDVNLSLVFFPAAAAYGPVTSN